MIKILVSACLVGESVRYDGKVIKPSSEILEIWKREGRIISVCPEVLGGLPVPRISAEIIGGQGEDVLAGQAKVLDKSDRDVTSFFLAGAQKALEIALKNIVSFAVLNDRSPSCGSTCIYNGQFDETLIAGMGVTTCLLRQHGIKVFTHHQLERAHEYLSNLEESTCQKF
jgi:uncharacterized protein YbbK (DUF523 family)